MLVAAVVLPLQELPFLHIMFVMVVVIITHPKLHVTMAVVMLNKAMVIVYTIPLQCTVKANVAISVRENMFTSVEVVFPSMIQR
jgi:hypothetical protein